MTDEQLEAALGFGDIDDDATLERALFGEPRAQAGDARVRPERDGGVKVTQAGPARRRR